MDTELYFDGQTISLVTKTGGDHQFEQWQEVFRELSLEQQALVAAYVVLARTKGEVSAMPLEDLLIEAFDKQGPGVLLREGADAIAECMQDAGLAIESDEGWTVELPQVAQRQLLRAPRTPRGQENGKVAAEYVSASIALDQLHGLSLFALKLVLSELIGDAD